jgi:hypothetical protein
VVAPPHVMIFYPDPKMLDAYPADPKSGGPWVLVVGSADTGCQIALEKSPWRVQQGGTALYVLYRPSFVADCRAPRLWS